MLRDDLIVRLKELGQWMTHIVIDIAFVSGWVIAQGWWTVMLKLLLVEQWILLTSRIIFNVSILIVILIYIYKDIRIMIIRTQKQIREDVQK